MKTLQIATYSAGSASHILFWAYQIGANQHPLGWLCGEISCWVLIVADLPLSHLYDRSNQSVTWGSLVLGTAWWGLLAAGVLNVIWPFALLVSARSRRRFLAAYHGSPVALAAFVAWRVGTVAALAVAARAILPWFY